MIDRNNPRRNEVLSLVRRQVRAGTFSKGDLDAWSEDLGADVVDAIVLELAPPKKARKKADKTPDTPVTKE